MPQPVFIIAAYDQNGIPNAMDSTWGGIRNENEISICSSSERKKLKNIMLHGAFTVSMSDASFLEACDYLGNETGNEVPNKFAKTGLKATKSKYVNAPIIEESTLVIECELTEIVRGNHIHAIVGKMVNIAVDESVLNERGKIDAKKTRMLFFDSFSYSYFTLRDKFENDWNEGREFMTLNR
ncbi:flavin reductase family protein [Priestia megaterium]|uniref:flavin reductase family protein n=1 Tax=Priestia megaterium TaxID=1404 RepID=UPI00296F9651|nr:flavin reductase family protein [Priestia megaterium]MDW4511806.1 flavin reductase family protein [Priestia megaterium]